MLRKTPSRYLLTISLLLSVQFYLPDVHAAGGGTWKWTADGWCGTPQKEVGSASGIAAYQHASVQPCASYITGCRALVAWYNTAATVTAVCVMHTDGTEAYYSGGGGARMPDEPEPPPGCGQPVDGHPVVFNRGEKYYHFEDARRGAAFPLVIDRSYRSHVRSDMKANGTWTFPYLTHQIEVMNALEVYAHQPNGMFLSFTRLTTSGAGDTFAATHAGFNYTLYLNKSVTPNQYELTQPDGVVQIYHGTPLRLQKILSPQGLTHSLAYRTVSAINYIDITDDQSDQTLTWKLNADNQPTELQDTTGASPVWIRKYRWDDIGRLQEVTYADETTSVDTDNFAQKFKYETANYNPATGQTVDDFRFLVTGIEECVGATCTMYSNVVYDSLGRVTSSGLLNGANQVETTSFAYDWDWSAANTLKPTTTVTNQSGLVTTYTYTTDRDSDGVNDGSAGKEGVLYSRNWLIENVDGAGHASTGCAATSADSTYSVAADVGGAGFLKTTSDNTGTAYTLRTRDPQRRIISLQTGLNSSLNAAAASQKVVTGYWGNSVLPASKTYYGYQSNAWNDYKRTEFTYYSGNNRMATRTEKDMTPSAYSDRVWTYHYAPSDTSIHITSMTVDGPLTGTGDSTVYRYDAYGHISEIENALGQKTIYADYNAFGLPETITDANGVVTSLTYGIGGQIATSARAGVSTTYTYYANGLLHEVIHMAATADEVSYEYVYNSAHQLTSVKHHHGTATDTMVYIPSELNGQWTDAITKDNSNAVVMEQHRLFDALGRLWEQQDANKNPKTVFGYDANNNIANIIAQGDSNNANRVAYRTHDGQNRITNDIRCTDTNIPIVIPQMCAASKLATTVYGYDDQGNTASVSIQDASNVVLNTTTYLYNGFGELIEQVSPDSGTTKYAYDKAGNLATKTKGFGAGADEQIINYTWDNLNRLGAINYPGTAEDVTYTYDTAAGGENCGAALGRLCRVAKGTATTDYTYNTLGRITAEKQRPIGSFALTTQYAYNAAGELTGITYPSAAGSGGRTVAMPHSEGRITSLASTFNSTTQTLADTLSYRPFGGITGYDLPNDGTTFLYRYQQSYNPNGQLSQIAVSSSNAGEHVRDYEYDAFGNVSDINANGVGQASYNYDALNRLKTAAGPYGEYEYEYDAVGNRTQQTKRNFVNNGLLLEDKWLETYQYLTGSNRLQTVQRKRIVGGTPEATPYRTRSFVFDGRGNIKTDTRSKTDNSTPPVTTTNILNLIYGNADRLNSVDVQ